MAHRLQPPQGQPYLSPTEIVDRLGDEFEFCNAVSGRHLAKILQSPISLPDDSYRVTVADGEAGPTQLTFVVHAGQALLIEYKSPQHEAETCLLLKRCADALGYERIRI